MSDGCRDTCCTTYRSSASLSHRWRKPRSKTRFCHDSGRAPQNESSIPIDPWSLAGSSVAVTPGPTSPARSIAAAGMVVDVAVFGVEPGLAGTEDRPDGVGPGVAEPELTGGCGPAVAVPVGVDEAYWSGTARCRRVNLSSAVRSVIRRVISSVSSVRRPFLVL
jgi:hypothetical protein